MWTPEAGRRLQELLTHAHMTQEKAAELADVDRSTISRWLHGRQSPLRPQSWKKRGLETLGRNLGFENLESLLEVLGLGGSDTGRASNVGAVGMQALQHVLLSGVASEASLASALATAAAPGVSECLEEELVVAREVGGERFYWDPGLALIREVARGPLRRRQLADELGLSLEKVDELTQRRAEDLNIGSRDTVALAPHQYAAIVFDWGDTLVNEGDYDDAICEQLAKKCRRDEFRELLDRLEANHDPRWYDYFFLADQLNIPRSEVVAAHKKNRCQMRWLPGALDVLRRAGAESEVVLATNCHSQVLRLRMDLLGLAQETFTQVVTSDQCESLRTKREMYVRILDGRNVAADEVLVISDSYDRDVLPALVLGCHAIWLRRGARHSFWGTPAHRPPAEAVHLMRSTLERFQLPDLVAFDHTEILAWLSGS